MGDTITTPPAAAEEPVVPTCDTCGRGLHADKVFGGLFCDGNHTYVTPLEKAVRELFSRIAGTDSTGDPVYQHVDPTWVVGDIAEHIKDTEAHAATLAARVAELETENVAERQKFADHASKIIDATGVEVPANGMTALEAVAALQQRVAAVERTITALRELDQPVFVAASKAAFEASTGKDASTANMDEVDQYVEVAAAVITAALAAAAPAATSSTATSSSSVVGAAEAFVRAIGGSSTTTIEPGVLRLYADDVRAAHEAFAALSIAVRDNTTNGAPTDA